MKDKVKVMTETEHYSSDLRKLLSQIKHKFVIHYSPVLGKKPLVTLTISGQSHYYWK